MTRYCEKQKQSVGIARGLSNRVGPWGCLSGTLERAEHAICGLMLDTTPLLMGHDIADC